MGRRVLRLEIEAFCHATEDLRKVKEAMLNVVPEDLRQKVSESLNVSMLEGFYGNPIFVLRVAIEDSDVAERIFMGILSRLSREDLEKLSLTVNQRLDTSGRLHLRLDKQRALMGDLRIYDGDDVVKVKAKLSRGMISAVREDGVKALVRV